MNMKIAYLILSVTVLAVVSCVSTGEIPVHEEPVGDYLDLKKIHGPNFENLILGAK